MSNKTFKSFLEASAPPAPPAPAEAELTPDSPEIALDPRLEKEIFIDTFEVNGKTVIIKSLGLGITKPVVVYIDDKRWEVFPGPRIAKREVRRHIKKSPKYAPGGKEAYKLENVDLEFETFLSEAVLTKSEVLKWLNKNKRKFDSGTEAAFAVADEFGMEDELENEKHWMWGIIKKMYKESYDFELPFLESLESKSFHLMDNTKVKMNPELANNIKNIYEYLEDTNKSRFREAFIINKINHNKIIDFVKEQTKGN
jgi:hypothetical protein